MARTKIKNVVPEDEPEKVQEEKEEELPNEEVVEEQEQQQSEQPVQEQQQQQPQFLIENGVLGFILKPGSSRHPLLLIALNVSFIAVFYSIYMIIYDLPPGSIASYHIWIMGFLALGLFASVQW